MRLDHSAFVTRRGKHTTKLLLKPALLLTVIDHVLYLINIPVRLLVYTRQRRYLVLLPQPIVPFSIMLRRESLLRVHLSGVGLLHATKIENHVVKSAVLIDHSSYDRPERQLTKTSCPTR